MLIISRMIKIQSIVLTMFLCPGAIASPIFGEHILQYYRSQYKDAVIPIKYVFVRENGTPCCETHKNGKVYLLNIRADAPVRTSYSSEINALFRAKFDVEVDSGSLITTPQADFIILTMRRPAEYNSKYLPCAVGMGEERAYLVSIARDNVTIVNRHFGGCGRRYSVRHPGEADEYEVSDGRDSEHITRYIIHGTSVVRVEDNHGKKDH